MSSRILLTGSAGLIGSSIKNKLLLEGKDESLILNPERDSLDLRDRVAVFKYFKKYKPDTIINCAAAVGGILGNRKNPVRYGTDNILIQTNLLDASYIFEVEKFIFFGSSCIYPKGIRNPIQENQLFSGELEESNLTFASAKLSGISLLEAYSRQYNLNKWITVIPTSIYGINDRFHTTTNHVIPALIEKFSLAVKLKKKRIEMIGDGSPLREFLNSEDLVDAISILLRLEEYEHRRYNIGSGTETSISNLTKIICNAFEYNGEVNWGTSLDNGVNRKFLDSSRIENLGFKTKINLEDGILEVIKHYKALTVEGTV